MSYYYNYYVGYKKDEKIYPLGLYNSLGKLCPVLSRSSSFASDLYKDFMPVADKAISNELRQEFTYKNWKNEDETDVKYLEVDKLPSSSFIKTGYFLIEDVKEYERDNDAEGLFYDYLSPTLYAEKAKIEILFGKNKPVKDDEYTEHNASDYMFYAYPDYSSREYESFLLHRAASSLEDYDLRDIEYVILETEG